MGKQVYSLFIRSILVNPYTPYPMPAYFSTCRALIAHTCWSPRDPRPVQSTHLVQRASENIHSEATSDGLAAKRLRAELSTARSADCLDKQIGVEAGIQPTKKS